MPVFGRELLLGAVLGLLAAWAYHRFAVPKGAPVFPIIVNYDQIGQARDRLGTPFSSYGINPSR
jgi:hypothetical protein